MYGRALLTTAGGGASGFDDGRHRDGLYFGGHGFSVAQGIHKFGRVEFAVHRGGSYRGGAYRCVDAGGRRSRPRRLLHSEGVG